MNQKSSSSSIIEGFNYDQQSNTRIRKLTEKGHQKFVQSYDELQTQLNAKWASVENFISSFSATITNSKYLDSFEDELSRSYAEFCTTSAAYMSFLAQTRTEESLKLYQEHSDSIVEYRNKIDETIQKINTTRNQTMENASRRSQRSGHSNNSQDSNATSVRKRAKQKPQKRG